MRNPEKLNKNPSTLTLNPGPCCNGGGFFVPGCPLLLSINVHILYLHKRGNYENRMG
jgi:hypothetical protein